MPSRWSVEGTLARCLRCAVMVSNILQYAVVVRMGTTCSILQCFARKVVPWIVNPGLESDGGSVTVTNNGPGGRM
jgi:hypothetical protein